LESRTTEKRDQNGVPKKVGAEKTNKVKQKGRANQSTSMSELLAFILEGH